MNPLRPWLARNLRWVVAAALCVGGVGLLWWNLSRGTPRVIHREPTTSIRPLAGFQPSGLSDENVRAGLESTADALGRDAGLQKLTTIERERITSACRGVLESTYLAPLDHLLASAKQAGMGDSQLCKAPRAEQESYIENFRQRFRESPLPTKLEFRVLTWEGRAVWKPPRDDECSTSTKPGLDPQTKSGEKGATSIVQFSFDTVAYAKDRDEWYSARLAFRFLQTSKGSDWIPYWCGLTGVPPGVGTLTPMF